MPDLRFFERAGPFTLAEIGARLGCRLDDGADADRLVTDVAPLGEAAPSEIGLYAEARLCDAYRATRAGAVLTSPALAAGAGRPSVALLLSDAPRLQFARLARLFYPADDAPAVASREAPRLGAGVRLGTGAVIGDRAEVGAGCRIGANAVIAPGVVIGNGCTIGDGASISHALLGDRVTVQAGARVGTPGFGFVADAAGPVRVPQLGRVVIGDGVEIGANSTIDRGALGDTVIGAGTVIDNLVQVAHNVRIGRCCVIAAQVGVAGSTRIGDGVMIGGQVAIADHLTIGSGVRIAARSGVMRDVADGLTIGGAPALPIREWHRQTATLARLARSRKGDA